MSTVAKPYLDEKTAEETRVEDLLREAEKGTEIEHNMTLWEGLRKYPKACFWSMMISVAVIMEGYDVVLLGNFCEWPRDRSKRLDLTTARRLPRVQEAVRRAHYRQER